MLVRRRDTVTFRLLTWEH